MTAPNAVSTLPPLSATPAASPYIANITAEPPPRFTVDGDLGLEEHLATVCRRIAAGLRGLLPARQLQAVLLGGGYGRGEGGVCRTSDGDRPYNDLEFYVFLRGNRHLNERRYGRALHVFGEILTPQAGIDVEFRIASLRELRRAGPSMFSYDLYCGHRVILGDQSILADCAHHEEAEEIPLAEATRLLMNRCTGLLLAQERLARATFSPADADFVGRNIAKAQLGAGDAVLTAAAQYHWSVRERHRRLERLVRSEATEWFRRLREHHHVGVEFKLHPERSRHTREALARRHAEVSALCREAWLWVEQRRLGRDFHSARDYALDGRNKCPEAPRLRSPLVNFKAVGWRGVMSPGRWRHPRERILATLPLLLWEHTAWLSPELLAHLQRQLRTSATDFAGLFAAYRRIWERVN
jgi:hypothetical protein